MPPGWPDLSADEGEALLAPFLECDSPAEFVELQDRVDMPRVVEALDDWSAVRLGALGPVREDAAEALNRKRVAFLLTASEKYAAYAEVFALFVLHSSHDDDLREMLLLLSRDKRLGELLEPMPAVREELEERGLTLSDYPDRAERASDVLRGLGRAARDALSTSQGSQDSRYSAMSAKWRQLPAPYQQALDELEKALMARHFSMGNVALGSFDSLTFGVPLGLYHLVMGTGQGVASLAQGRYEKATRELAPAALLVAVYAGGKGVRALTEARGASGAGPGGLRGLPVSELRTKLSEVVTQLEARLGGEALGELARHIRARREAARFVAVGGADAAVALHTARGDVAKAQAWLSQARPQRAGATPKRASTGKRSAGVSSLVDEQVGLTEEVVEARLAQVELESTGPRLTGNVATLERQRPSLEAPPPGAQGSPRWSEYVAYYESRVAELKQGLSVKNPLAWAGYEQMRGLFARGLAFERMMVELLRADAALPRALRRFLGDFIDPRIETYVGVMKPKSGLRFADVLVIEQQPPPGSLPRVETFSFKSRNLSLLDERPLREQLKTDASEALLYYGETLDIRRPSLQPLLREGSKVPVQRVRLIYEGGDLKPGDTRVLKPVLKEVRNAVRGVEVLFQ